MKEHLVIFGPVEEFHTFQKFNTFIYNIKKDYRKISAVIFEKAIGIVSEADELLIISNDYLDSNNANYPYILEILSNRNISPAYNIALIKIKELYPESEILYYDYLNIKNEKGDIVYDWFSVNSVGSSYNRDVKYVRNWLKDGKLLYSSIESNNFINKNYNDLIDDNTFIIITRNFQNKQVEMNTNSFFPYTHEFIQYLIDNGNNVVNIGYPPMSYSIKNSITSEYKEINPNFNQDVLFGLFNRAKAVLTFSSGSFINLCAYANMVNLQIDFLKVWEDGESFITTKKRNKKIKSFEFIEEYENKNFELIYNSIKNLKPPTLKFSKEQKKLYLI